jgi:hypothetical protein|uniref:Uncharacterized protein n=1 Tax=viral metagenome TaxID=1070528 RepID=A0A6C0KUJ6_9ZZZZ
MDNIKAFFIIIAIFIIIVLIYPILKRPSGQPETTHIHVDKHQIDTNLCQKNKENEISAKEIDTYFKPPTPCIPIDYPTKEIGECPYSKPMSMDLPIANTMMCFAKEKKNMYLRIKNDNM